MSTSRIDTDMSHRTASIVAATEVKPPLPIGLEHAGIGMTNDEFDAIEEYDDSYCYELIHGVLVASPLPYLSETGPNEMLGHMLLTYAEQHPNGRFLDATFPEQIIRTLTSRRRADRVIWAGLGRPPKLQVDIPTIAVEFVSRAKRDRQRDFVEKRHEYLSAGVIEFWIIDRFLRMTTVVRKCAGGIEELVLHETDTYVTALLPGFELSVARIFTAADRAKQSE